MNKISRYVITGIRQVGKHMELSMSNKNSRRVFKLDDPKDYTWVQNHLAPGIVITFNQADQKIATDSPLFS